MYKFRTHKKDGSWITLETIFYGNSLEDMEEVHQALANCYTTQAEIQPENCMMLSKIFTLDDEKLIKDLEDYFEANKSYTICTKKDLDKFVFKRNSKRVNHSLDKILELTDKMLDTVTKSK